ncbi:hypothetical protein QYE76_056111 [Lolium multiflorum]|uniref:Uncharacterized protein n=1 Tax=Lolium multiflorum TaxID=4521 RepID=A0AAD8T1L1_LOLMU|nr:hypothetical protein QYE76_056111 [Lolium multiflorum]
MGLAAAASGKVFRIVALETHHTLLNTLDKILGQGDAAKALPRRGHHDQARQSAHRHGPGRTRTPSVLVDADHSRPSPLSPRIAVTSAHAQTAPLVLRCAVDAVIVNLCRASTARTTTSPERLRPPPAAHRRFPGPP